MVEATSPCRIVEWPAAGTPQHLAGRARTVRLDGRLGVCVRGIRDHLRIDTGPFLSGEQGTVTVTVAALESLYAAAHHPSFDQHLSSWDEIPLLSDRPPHEGMAAASFGIFFKTDWHPGLIGKLFRGSVYPDAFSPEQKACAFSNHFSLPAHKWIPFAMTWDTAARSVRLYACGVLVGVYDTLAETFLRDHPRSGMLYFGHPNLLVSEVSVHAEALDGAQIERRAQLAGCDASLVAELRATHAAGEGPALDFSPGPDWQEKLCLPLNCDADLAHFYVQGMTSSPRITTDGLLVETSTLPPGHTLDPTEGRKHVYLWTDRRFDGDLYVRYEYKALAPGGLSLLILKASGMQGEDYMADYPLRTDGSMRMLCWEDVRNYHWEYHRQMNDVRNDGASHALMKNPWLCPLAYRCFAVPQEIGRWYLLEFVMEGARLRGAIDEQLVFDVTDRPDTNNGPVYRGGRIGIRCMTRTKILFRNLEVLTRDDLHTEAELP